MEKKGKNIILLSIVAIVIVIAVVVGIYFVNRSAGSRVYLKKLETAVKYLDSGDYDNAILTLEKLIQEEPEKEEPYSRLAGIYAEQKNYTQACSVLQLGIGRTGSDELKRMLAILLPQAEEAEKTDGKREMATGDDEQEDSGLKNQVSLLAADFREYSAKDYESNFGTGTPSNTGQEGILKVNYQNLDADVYYRNTSSSRAFQEDNLNVYEISRPYRIVFRNLETWIYGISYPAEIETLETFLGFRPIINDNEERGTKQLEFTYRFCVCRIECDENGTIPSSDAWSEMYLDGKSGEEEDGGATFQGQVLNAKTGLGVENAEVTFVDANGKEQMATTDGQGYYEVRIEAGDFTIQVSAEGFQEEEFERDIEDLQDSVEGVLTITPSVGENEIVIVLEWEATPEDLDAVLQCDDFMIDFRNREDSNSSMEAVLDVDEVNGYGPETITVNITGDAEFTYVVNNYRNDPNFAGCGATVKVYISGQAPIEYTIPSSGSGTKIWEVFQYKNGKIIDINDVHDVSNVVIIDK